MLASMKKLIQILVLPRVSVRKVVKQSLPSFCNQLLGTSIKLVVHLKKYHCPLFWVNLWTSTCLWKIYKKYHNLKSHCILLN